MKNSLGKFGPEDGKNCSYPLELSPIALIEDKLA